MSLLSGFKSLAKNVNKVISSDREENVEGVVSDLVPELSLRLDDEKLISLKKTWLKNWEDYNKTISKEQKENEEYWLGQQFCEDKSKRPLVDNLIFESVETFLPIATRPKADPLVESKDQSPEAESLSDNVRKMLAYQSDRLVYNLKVKQVARYWALYKLGVLKVGWSEKKDDIDCFPVRPQKLILDPTATIDECEYTGYYIGEYVKDTASDLILRFPKKQKFITEKVDGKMGTSVEYIQWWTDDYIFYTLGDEVLDKKQNPHWNYPTNQPLPADPMTGVQPVDQTGQPQTQQVDGNNHFSNRKKPYVFLSIFNLGKQPHDDTNLVTQSLPLQDLVNKRLSQVDKNADNANGGLIVSGDAFTEEQAQKAGKSLRKGGVIWVPSGDVNNSVKRDGATPLPPFVYESLLDYRNELRNIFGTRGSTPQGTAQEKTVGGKVIIKGQDADRIGGGISSYLEQFSDKVYNWFVQLMYVYYDEPHTAVVLGKEKSKEYITIRNSDLVSKLLVGVKEGSMVPQDPLSKRNEAMELWAQKGLDPITFFDRLEFPNPRETAKQLFLWLSDPIQLFPDLAQAQAAQQQQQLQDQQMQQQGQQQQAQVMQDQANQQKIGESQLKHAQTMQQIEAKKPVPSPIDYQNLMLNQ